LIIFWSIKNLGSKNVSVLSTCPELVIPPSRLVTVGDRSFVIASSGTSDHLYGVSTKTDNTLVALVSAILLYALYVACLPCCTQWSLKFLLRPP